MEDEEKEQNINPKTIGTIATTVLSVITNKKLNATIFGKYTDGEPRSLTDWLDGEILSPKDREKLRKKNDKIKKKKKKDKNKKKKKKNKFDLDV